MKTKFTTPDIERLGIKRSRLKEWIVLKCIKPSVQEADGRGTKHIFDRDDIYAIFFFEELINQGLSRKLAGEIVNQFFFDLSRFSKAIKEGFHYLVISRVAVPGEKPTMQSQLILEIPTSLPPTFSYQWAFNLRNIKDRVDAMIG
jgi:hypothetical protein